MRLLFFLFTYFIVFGISAQTTNFKEDYKEADQYHNLKKYDLALPLYKKVAEQGSVHAQFNVGTYYLLGLGITKNHYQAINWFKKAAKQGHIRAQYNLGELYISYMKDIEKGVYWLEKAAKSGYGAAQTNLGITYYDRGEYNKAADWFFKAVQKQIPEAYYYMGLMYQKGHGVKRSKSDAKYCYKKACDLGDDDACYKLLVIKNGGWND